MACAIALPIVSSCWGEGVGAGQLYPGHHFLHLVEA
jgi:hypothetical protein